MFAFSRSILLCFLPPFLIYSSGGWAGLYSNTAKMLVLTTTLWFVTFSSVSSRAAGWAFGNALRWLTVAILAQATSNHLSTVQKKTHPAATQIFAVVLSVQGICWGIPPFRGFSRKHSISARSYKNNNTETTGHTHMHNRICIFHKSFHSVPPLSYVIVQAGGRVR